MTTGDKAPEILGKDQNGNEVRLSDFAGKKLVLYFYPKDNTPGCTRQACAFAESYKEFEKMHSNLAGQCQRENLATALEIVKQLRTLGYEIPDEAVRDGFAKTVWEGRFTCLRKNPVFIIDGAHNEDAAIKLRTSV